MELKSKLVRQFKELAEAAKEKGDLSFDFHGDEVPVDAAFEALKMLESTMELIDTLREAKQKLSEEKVRRLKKLADFFDEIGFDQKDIENLFDHISKKLRSHMDDEMLTTFDEMTDEERYGFICDSIVEGKIGLGAIEVQAEDGAPEGVTIN